MNFNWHVADAKAIDLHAGDTENPSGLVKIESQEEAEFIKSIIKCKSYVTNVKYKTLKSRVERRAFNRAPTAKCTVATEGCRG